MTTVETRVVNPVSRAGVDHATEAELDAAMTHEEETILVDEEISSSEGAELENHMLTVALVNSVVEATPADPSGRYGLRKRRRPGDVTSPKQVQDPSRPDHASCGGDEHAPRTVASSKAVGTTQHISKSQRIVPAKQEPRTVPPAYKPTTGAKAKQRQEPLIIKQSNTKTGTQIKDHPILGKLTSNFTHLAGSGKPQGALLPPPAKPLSSSKQKPVPPRAKVKHPGQQLLVRQNLVPTSGAVPNPLLHTPATPVPAPRVYAPKTSNHPGAKSKTVAVPCPLPSVPCPLQLQSVTPAPVAPVSVAPAPVPSAPVPSSEKKRVTISEPTIPPARARIFSVDLDREYCSLSTLLNPL
mmetsp:Transcript_39320/g.95147  ORF Transcript_39320/g.95147 Transcript_39320/m.95147 type:complete len:354 (-) Transcript_39320:797-1858(-)